MHLILVLLIQ